MITSQSNPRIRNVVNLRKKAKERSAQDVFLVEGIRMFREIPKQLVKEVYVSEHFLAREENRRENERALRAAGVPFEIVSDAVFEKMADTKTPQGVIAVVGQLHYSFEDLLENGERKGRDQSDGTAWLASPGYREERGQGKTGRMEASAPLLLILENLQDPGNLGTILRSSEGAGVTGILLSSDCVDLYSPKVIRSTMGSAFRVPFLYTDDLHGRIRQMKEKGVRLYAAHLKGTKQYTQPDYTGPCGFLIGNEGNGLTDATAALADDYIRIPMQGRVESLNASVAASLLAYEALRQRMLLH